MKKLSAILGEITSCENISFKPFIELKSGTLSPASSRIEINEKEKTCRMDNGYGAGIEEKIYFTWRKGGSTWQRSIKNISPRQLKLVETGIIIGNISFGGKCLPEKDYFYHTENPRIYDLLTIPVDVKRTEGLAKESSYDEIGGNKWADPGVVSERIGASPYQPFPAILLSNYSSGRGIVHGSLSQKVFYHNYMLNHEDKSLTWKIFSSLKAVEYRNLIPGEVIDSDRWYLGVSDAADIAKIFEEYMEELRKILPVNRGRTDTNRGTVVWGSWNDGLCRDIDRARILKNAEFIRRNLPTVEWIQIDNGYAVRRYGYGGMAVPYEGARAIDSKKFPGGLRNFTDSIKAKGLKPAIWIGGGVDNNSRLARDKKKWFVDYSYRITESSILDVSLPEVREYMKKAIDVLLTDCGFEGMKHDFWSYVFEDSKPLLSVKDKSGYEWRTWWLREICSRLPAQGYLQTGCDIVMGNPFLGEYFNNYRYGIDVGSGQWDRVVTNFLWGAACFATHGGDLIVPNSDSIGLLPGLTEKEAFTWTNYCIISRSLVEIAGWLYQHPRDPGQYRVKKAICCPNNGEDVFFSEYDYRSTNQPPDIWYFKGAHFSRVRGNPVMPLRTVAVFNLTDGEKRFSLKDISLALPEGKYVATDMWTSESLPLDNYIDFSLTPHESILLSINKNEKRIQLLDSDIRIGNLTAERKGIILELDSRGDFKILFSCRPSWAGLKNGKGRLRIVEGEGNWIIEGAIPCSDMLTVRFKE